MIKQYKANITDFTQADYTNWYSLLECAIREKIKNKNNSISQKQSLLGYTLFYRAAEEIYQKKQFKINFNKYGKPLCDFCYFSISHSEEQAICVVSDKAVGVDIQKIQEIKPRAAYKFFNAQENDYVNQNENLISRRYIEIFTKKEAAVKMLGLSIAHAGNIDTFSNEYSFEIEEIDGFCLCVCQKNDQIL